MLAARTPACVSLLLCLVLVCVRLCVVLICASFVECRFVARLFALCFGGDFL